MGMLNELIESTDHPSRPPPSPMKILGLGWVSLLWTEVPVSY